MIHVYDKIFLKVVSEDYKFYKGFDIFTETYFEVPKTENYIILSESIISLFKEKNRYLLATKLTKNHQECSEILGVTTRSVFRMKNKYE